MERGLNDEINKNTFEYIPGKESHALIINDCYKDDFYGDCYEEFGRNLSDEIEIMDFSGFSKSVIQLRI